MTRSPELFGTPEEFVIDPVHGGIPFFSHERVVINHRLFQRLRYINQTDLLSFVFPAATHSRFLHSIGTMHVASSLFQRVVRAHLLELRAGDFARIEQRHIQAVQYFHACVRLAALLHDTGHAPFSHQLENSRVVKKLFSDDAIFDELWDKISWRRFYSTKPKELKHEHYSARCAYQILYDCTKLPVDLVDVIGVLERTSTKPTKLFINHAMSLADLLSPDIRERLKKVEPAAFGYAFQSLFSAMISGPLDVDKMDYLLRDSYFSGCMHGIYSLPHLLNNIRIGLPLSSVEERRPTLILSINAKGVGALEEFVYSRYQLYTQIYSHKTYSAFKLLLREAISEVFRISNIRQKVANSLSDLSMFADFTDTFFWEHFRNYGASRPKSACHWLIRRKRLKCIRTVRERNPETITNIRAQLRQKRKDVLMEMSQPKFSEITPAYTKIMVRRFQKNGRKEQKVALEAIEKHTNFFDMPRDVYIAHFFGHYKK